MDPAAASAAKKDITFIERDQQLNSWVMIDATATRIIEWLQQIGLGVRLAPLGADTFLPGVTLEPGGLIVDPERLLYPGDLLHEAGHLATMLPAQRASAGPNAGSENHR